MRWIDVELAGSAGAQFSFGATLFASGDVLLSYGELADDAYGYAGVSIGNGVGTGLENSAELIAGADSGALGLLFGEYSGLERPPVSGKAIALVPNGLGGFASTLTCRSAEHVAYGVGCYDYQDPNEAVYQLFPTAAASFAAIPSGRSVQFAIAGPNSYLVTNGGGSYVTPPPTATVLTLTDDSSVSVTPSQPFPHANGTNYSTISICSNGFVNMAPAGVNANGTGGSATSLLNAPAPSFRAQRDYNPAPAASGKVKRHEAVVGGETILYATWDGVFIYNTTTPERFQIQLNLTTGTVTMVWNQMVPSTSVSRPLLIGLAQGNSFNPGSIDFAVALPVLTSPDIELRPLTLSASPEPVLNPATLVTYTIENIPEAVPGSGIHLSAVFLSTGALPGGLDLGLLGAPGCSGYLASLDLPLSVAPSLTATATTTLNFSTPQLPPGVVVYAQAIALFDPAFPLPNGQNSFGLTTSNGIASYVEPF